MIVRCPRCSIMVDVMRSVIDGGETNYIMATLGIYVDAVSTCSRTF